MLKRIVLNFLIVLGLSTAQLAFIGGLPDIFSGLNLVIAALVFTLALKDFTSAALIAVGIGFIEDIYSFHPFGLHLISLFLTITLINFLFVSFLTNRSLYSFIALVTLANLIYIFVQEALTLGLNYYSGGGGGLALGMNFWTNAVYAIILNLFLTVIIFYLINFISQRFKPVFLVRLRQGSGARR